MAANPSQEMGRREAAEFLGVSVRTLSDWIKNKTLPCQYQKGPTRSRVVFQREDVQRLKDARTRSLSSEPTENSNRIQFRVNDPDYHALEAGAVRHDMSVNVYARSLTLEMLGLREELSALRADYQKTTTALAEAQNHQDVLEAERARLNLALTHLRDNYEGDFEAICLAFFEVLKLLRIPEAEAQRWVDDCLRGENTAPEA
jgi:DNA-binding transcriptional MerR regulator